MTRVHSVPQCWPATCWRWRSWQVCVIWCLCHQWCSTTRGIFSLGLSYSFHMSLSHILFSSVAKNIKNTETLKLLCCLCALASLYKEHSSINVMASWVRSFITYGNLPFFTYPQGNTKILPGYRRWTRCPPCMNSAITLHPHVPQGPQGSLTQGSPGHLTPARRHTARVDAFTRWLHRSVPDSHMTQQMGDETS